ncbi:MAG: Cna B-type domain-containing protein [Leuconostoc gelidum]|uniref:Cna B-type domain-containing protein n=1 Tax=Leuconostoc gelidum TaxID=1244 RepID=UPI002F355DA7
MFKKTATFFSLLIIMSTFFVTPVSVLAESNTDNASTAMTSSSAISNSDIQPVEKSTEKQEVSKSMTPDLPKVTPATDSTTQAGKIKSSTIQPRAPTVTASKDWGDQFITKAELEDENGKPQTNFDIYDDMQAHWDMTIPAGTNIKTGDTMTVAIPSVLTMANDVTFDITDVAGNVIGHAVADHNTGKVTITFTDHAEQSAKNGISGNFNIWVHWDHTQVEEDTTVPVDWGNGGSTDIDIDPGNDGPDPDEELYKWGWYDSNDPTIIHWRVRLNYAKVDIKNAVYTDFVGGNQKLVAGSIQAYHVEYNSDGTDFTQLNDVPSSDVFEDSALKFHVNLHELTDTVLVDYDTKVTDGGTSTKYENSGQLTGENIEKQTIDVYSPNNGGGGDGETTETIDGTKTWQDDNDVEGLRPDAITIDIYQNGVKINSKIVTAESGWKYSMTDLPKFDADGNAYIYTVKEKTVDHYRPSQAGYNFTNTLSDITKIAGTKTWDDQNNQDGKRPDAIKVNLLANGKGVQTKTITANDDWQYQFTDLPKYDNNGKKIIYTITEDKVSGYETEIVNYDLINHYTPTPPPTPINPDKPIDPVIPITPNNPVNPVLPWQPNHKPVSLPNTASENIAWTATYGFIIIGLITVAVWLRRKDN